MWGEEPSQAQRHRRGPKNCAATRAPVRRILKPAQQAKYDEFAGSEGRGGTVARVWVVGKDGKPESVSVTLGLSDGTATEVLRGLQEGQEVIIGAGGARPTTPQTQGGPRL